MIFHCSREAAFQALIFAHKEERPLIEFLEVWNKEAAPSSKDYHLAQEIAFGVQRRLATLDYLGKQLNGFEPLKLKAKEKMILRMALYQFYFLDRIPAYALVDESVRLAKKHCHIRFAQFLNALLRKLSCKTPDLPQGNSLEDFAISYSFTPFFIQELIVQYGEDRCREMLTVLNEPSATMARKRNEKKLTMVPVPSEQREEIAKSTDYYIQNITPAHLIDSLAKEMSAPSSILDLCSAPGGKLFAAHDAFPNAELIANDISEHRLQRLRENCRKYNIRPSITCFSAIDFPEERTFDLIILDVPCSNSGVLHKRPEARWRVSSQCLDELNQLQFSLLQKAARLLSSCGEIWYITCSILSQENEAMVQKAVSELGLVVQKPPIKCLPNKEGWDGGFACRLAKNPPCKD